MQETENASISIGFYTLIYIVSADVLLPIQPYTYSNDMEYFVISRFTKTDISWAVLPDKLARDLHKQEMVSPRGSK
jgi:hypothetical protein